jgi:hypothetical protein
MKSLKYQFAYYYDEKNVVKLARQIKIYTTDVAMGPRVISILTGTDFYACF